jgi:MoaA/NifB/PqqE/SkfB family radical SAM enzyme
MSASTAVPAARDVARRLKQYAYIGASSLGLTGGHAPSGPLHAQIGVCDPCNHRCVMCWDHPPDERESGSTADRFGQQMPGLMTFERFRSVADDLHALGTRRIDLVGRGEPLLNGAIDQMVRYAKDRGFMVTLCTNASRLTDARARLFVEAGLDRMNVSLNAGRAETYPRIHVTETPDDYRQVKRNLAAVAAIKRASGARSPHVKLSFVVSALNAAEIGDMVAGAAEVAANEAYFVHTVVHEGTPDLALSRDQYERLLESLPAACDAAAAAGITTNLGTFGATIPTYLDNALTGPPVVPCYVGWYFTVVLGNGSVMPCCQCSQAIDRITPDKGFAEIWDSKQYGAFRTAARALPARNDALASCECDRCMLRPRNISIHNMLHPFARIEGGDEEQYFTLADLVRMKKEDRSRPAPVMRAAAGTGEVPR